MDGQRGPPDVPLRYHMKKGIASPPMMGADYPRLIPRLVPGNGRSNAKGANRRMFSLALNAMSFPEMSPAQVRYYAEFLKRCCVWTASCSTRTLR